MSVREQANIQIKHAPRSEYIYSQSKMKCKSYD